MKQIEIQEQEIQRMEKQLESKVKKPAEAERFRLQKIAEANRQKKVLEAEAESEALQLKGEAEAYAIEAKAKAEAEQMSKKADAWGEYEKAALVDMMLQVICRQSFRGQIEIDEYLSNCKCFDVSIPLITGDAKGRRRNCSPVVKD